MRETRSKTLECDFMGMDISRGCLINGVMKCKSGRDAIYLQETVRWLSDGIYSGFLFTILYSSNV